MSGAWTEATPLIGVAILVILVYVAWGRMREARDPAGAASRAAKRTAQRRMRRALGHGRLMFGLADSLKLPTVAAVTIGAFFKLAAQGVPESVVDAATRGATIELLLAGDVAVIVAFLRIADAKHRGLRFWRSSGLDLGVAVAVGALEAWTFYLLLVHQPAPDQLDGLRACAAIVTAVYLGVVERRPPNQKQVTQLAGEIAGEALITQMIGLVGAAHGADMGALHGIMSLALDDGLSWTERSERLVDQWRRLAAGSLGADLEAELRAQIAAAQADGEEAATRLGQRISMGLLQMLTTRRMPETLIAIAPELAEVDVAGLFAQGGEGGSGRGGRSGAGRGGQAAPRSVAEAQRHFLQTWGVERPSASPQGKVGCWVRAADLGALCVETLDETEPARTIKRCNPGGLKAGGSLVARFGDVVGDLAARNLLRPEVAAAFAELTTRWGRDTAGSPDPAGAGLATLEAASAQ